MRVCKSDGIFVFWILNVECVRMGNGMLNLVFVCLFNIMGMSIIKFLINMVRMFFYYDIFIFIKFFVM